MISLFKLEKTAADAKISISALRWPILFFTAEKALLMAINSPKIKFLEQSFHFSQTT